MLFQGKDGELRIIERGDYGGASYRKGVTYYLEALFTGMDFSAPIDRPKTEERIILNRNVFDSDANYVQGSEEAVMTPMAMTFTYRIDDKQQSKFAFDWFSGATEVAMTSGVTILNSWDGNTLFGGVSLPTFSDDAKQSYRVEVIWTAGAGGSDYGIRYEEVYFPPDQQTMTESEDALTISCNGLIYGDVSRITAFTAGLTQAS